jgi:hypothetical protein
MESFLTEQLSEDSGSGHTMASASSSASSSAPASAPASTPASASSSGGEDNAGKDKGGEDGARRRRRRTRRTGEAYRWKTLFEQYCGAHDDISPDYASVIDEQRNKIKSLERAVQLAEQDAADVREALENYKVFVRAQAESRDHTDALRELQHEVVTQSLVALSNHGGKTASQRRDIVFRSMLRWLAQRQLVVTALADKKILTAVCGRMETMLWTEKRVLVEMIEAAAM